MLTSVIEPFVDRGLRIAAVWIPMLPGDTTAAAETSSAMFDTRITQFYDANRKLGDAIAATLDAPATAWDMYLAYDSASRWTVHAPPQPAAYVHQLSNWADASRYRTGDALTTDLRRLAELITRA